MEPEILPALGFVIAFGGVLWLLERREKTRRTKEDERLESCKYSVATIARNLAPKLRSLMKTDPAFSSPTLYVVGGDGYPLWMGDDDYPWKDMLKNILRGSGTIHYILTNASVSVVAKMPQLKMELENGASGNIHFYFARSDQADGSDKGLIEDFRTFHPTLIEGQGKRAMWVEGYHPEHSTVAYSCRFVSPADIDADLEYDRYMESILRLMKNWSETGEKKIAA